MFADVLSCVLQMHLISAPFPMLEKITKHLIQGNILFSWTASLIPGDFQVDGPWYQGINSQASRKHSDYKI